MAHRRESLSTQQASPTASQQEEERLMHHSSSPDNPLKKKIYQEQAFSALLEKLIDNEIEFRQFWTAHVKQIEEKILSEEKMSRKINEEKKQLSSISQEIYEKSVRQSDEKMNEEKKLLDKIIGEIINKLNERINEIRNQLFKITELEESIKNDLVKRNKESLQSEDGEINLKIPGGLKLLKKEILEDLQEIKEKFYNNEISLAEYKEGKKIIVGEHINKKAGSTPNQLRITSALVDSVISQTESKDTQFQEELLEKTRSLKQSTREILDQAQQIKQEISHPADEAIDPQKMLDMFKNMGDEINKLSESLTETLSSHLESLKKETPNSSNKDLTKEAENDATFSEKSSIRRP